MKRLVCTLVFAIALTLSSAWAQVHIQSGPMPGYTSMGGVGIWMQLSGVADVSLRYWDAERPGSVYSADPSFHDTAASQVAKFHLSELTPGTTYSYEVVIDDSAYGFEGSLKFRTQPNWPFREDPPTFNIALGSCTYINEASYDRPGTPYGSNYGIFESIADRSPDLMLWLGDNIYLRDYDLGWKGGYLHRYSHTRSIPAVQRLLRSTHHYAIWDDHDFGPNDANGSWIHKDWAVEAFKLFWMNPSYGVPEIEGITSAFRFHDIDFFLLDNRYYRTSHDIKQGEPQILGKEQVEWLIEALKYSNAPFKLVAVGGQVLNPARVFENHAQYEEEREYLLSRIVEEKIKGVIFLTGDRHHTELRKASRDKIDIYDLTVSPLTSGTHEAKNESSEYLVEGTVVNEHNFAVLEVSGERLARQLKISIFDKEGSELWTKIIYP